MITLRAIPSARKSRAAVSRKLWCQRLNCGRILGEREDETMLLCERRFGHAPGCSHSVKSRAALSQGTQTRAAMPLLRGIAGGRA
jgi:hypothetical protein